MNFYRRRPLALIITLCLLTSAAVYFLPDLFKLLLLLLIAVLTPIIIKIIRRSKITAICNLAPTFFAVICAVLMMVTVLISFAYYDVFAARYEMLSENRICATVVSVESRTSYGAVYAVRITDRDGTRQNAKGLLASDTALGLSVGDTIETGVLFCELDEFYTYRDADATELLSDGYAFACNTIGDVRVTGERVTLEVFFSRLRETFGERMALYLDSDSAALANALLLGERSDLGKIKRDFTYTGAIHLLALSGMHLGIICGGFERLLMRLGIGAKTRYAATTILILFYVALTGFLMSTLRATVMLILSHVAAFLDADNDRITSLFVSVGLIVLVNPPAVFDVSLQLSFFATLGVLLMTEPTKKYTNARCAENTVWHPIFSSLRDGFRNTVASLGAAMFILPLQWIYFGEVSLMSVLATLVLSIVCEALLTLLVPFLICSLLGWHFACGMLGAAVRILAGVCTWTAEKLSEYSSLVSLGYPFAVSIMLVCISVIVWMMVRDFPNWLYALIPFFAASVLFLGAVHIYDRVFDERVTIDFASMGTNDMITLVSKRSAAVIDLGDGSSQTMYAAMDFLSERYITEVETLVLTRLHRHHVSSVRTLLNHRKVKRIIVVRPSDEYEMYIAADIISLANKYGTEAVFYDNDNGAVVMHGDVSVSMPVKTMLSRSERPLKALRFVCGDTTCAYVGASAWESDAVWDFVSGAEYMIFGANGPIVKTSPKGTVSNETDMVCAASEELVAALAPWIADFGGTLCVDNKLSAVIKP